MTKKLASPKESQECIWFMEWAFLQKELWDDIAHIGNERKCSYQTGFLLKRMGVKAGHFDYFLAIMSKGFGGLYIEMKRSDGRKRPLPENQLAFQSRKRMRGYKAEFAFGAKEAIDMVCEYLGMKNK